MYTCSAFNLGSSRQLVSIDYAFFHFYGSRCHRFLAQSGLDGRSWLCSVCRQPHENQGTSTNNGTIQRSFNCREENRPINTTTTTTTTSASLSPPPVSFTLIYTDNSEHKHTAGEIMPAWKRSKLCSPLCVQRTKYFKDATRLLAS